MKLYLSLFSLFFCSISYCQTEFKDHGNGLIYSNQVMSKLSQIVDSENQQFRVCELTKTYVSQIQALCTVYKVDSKYNNAIIKDAKAGISEERFKTKYKINSTANELAVKREYTDYQEKERVNIKLFPSSEAIYYDKKDFSKHHIKNWLIQDNNQETFKVLYFKTPLKAKNIPDNYGRMLLYSECMIDTTTTIHPKTAKEYGRWDEEEDAPKHQKQLEDYIIKKLGKNPPVFNENEANPDKDYSDYWEDLKAYENEKNALIKHTLKDDPTFKNLLNNAYQNAVKTGTALAEFEEYVAQYLGKKQALDLKRNRIVYGSCSMDSSPRYHAQEIAMLAAESNSWDIFLRAHLNIMNDNFQRVSDGSYAQAGRKTYIKELEELNINVKELLLGISFSISNENENHYFGNVRRLGRAVSESDQVPAFKKEIISAIENEQLDDYNRILMFYLYANLQYNLDLVLEKEFDESHIEIVRAKLPSYLANLEY